MRDSTARWNYNNELVVYLNDHYNKQMDNLFVVIYFNLIVLFYLRNGIVLNLTILQSEFNICCRLVAKLIKEN